MTNGAKNELELEAKAVYQEQSRLARTTTHPLVRSVLGTAPFTGGLASLLGDVAQKRQEIRLRRFLISLAEEVEENSDRISEKLDKEFLLTEECAALLETVLHEAARTADEEKLRFLKNFLLSATRKFRPDATWQELFMKYVRELSGVHLVILAVFYEIQGELPTLDRVGGTEIHGKVPLDLASVNKRLGSLDDALVKVASIDLANLGLLVDWHIVRKDAGPMQERYCLSDSGVLFMRFLDGAWR